ncbi:MAG: HDOD domain-containing protein [Syntrophales bacterium LBB04]|nr:HDOD domain-containing protein [Syntrophales bacterium LBB04]
MTLLQTQYVSSGTFTISEQKPLVLKACLGTCVGVALYDPQSRIGGLLHLILPSPPCPESRYHREGYASTGLPLFIRALLDRGALVENLEAFIAGGALVGPVGAKDIALDIGGRTGDIVKMILNTEGIRLKHSEIGGFFSCTLNMNMATFEASVVPVNYKPLPPNFTYRKPTAAEIRATVDHLQPIPQVALKILRLLKDDQYDIKTISREIRQDQVIVARVLKLCNSPLYAGNVQIDSLDNALLLLGQRLLIKTIVTASVTTFYNQSDSGYSLCKGGLYHHAIGTALVAENIAAATGKASPSTSYTAGLLHDIGMVVLDQYLTSVAPLFYRELHQEGSDMLELEKQMFGINHCEAGKELAVMWNLPGTLADSIYHHHCPEAMKEDAELNHIVYLADLIMSRFHSGLEIESLDTTNLESRMNLLGLPVASFSDLLDRIPINVFNTSLLLANA